MRIVSSMLIVLLIVLGFYSLEQQERPPLDPVSFLPSDTLIYFEQREAKKSFDAFQHSNLAKTLSEIDLGKALKDAGFEEEKQRLAATTIDLFKGLDNNLLIRELLGSRFTFAFFPNRVWSDSIESPQEYLKKHFLIITEPDMGKAALAILAADYTAEIDKSVVLYGRHSITRYSIGDSVLSVVLYKGLFLASFEERILREALSLAQQPGKGLRSLPAFQHYMEKFPDADRLSYLSVKGIQQLAEYLASECCQRETISLLKGFSRLKGVSSIGYGSWRKSSPILDQLVVSIDRTTIEAQQLEMVDTPPELNHTLPFVANDVLFYYWSNTFSAKLLWSMYCEDREQESLKRIEKNFRKITGFSVNDVIEKVDSNIAMLMRKSELMSFVPIPDIALIIKLNDSDGIDKILRSSLLKLDVSIKKRQYKGIGYYYWGVYPHENLQPVYAVHRDYLIVANTLSILKNIVDTPVTANGLLWSDSFAGIDPGFQRMNNSVSYVDHSALIHHVNDLVEWLATLSAIQGPETARKAKVLSEQVVKPLLEAVTVYDHSASRTSVHEDSIIIETMTELVEQQLVQ